MKVMLEVHGLGLSRRFMPVNTCSGRHFNREETYTRVDIFNLGPWLSRFRVWWLYSGYSATVHFQAIITMVGCQCGLLKRSPYYFKPR